MKKFEYKVLARIIDVAFGRPDDSNDQLWHELSDLSVEGWELYDIKTLDKHEGHGINPDQVLAIYHLRRELKKE